MALTAEEVKNNLINQILYNFPTADISTGSVIRDIMVDPQSVQIGAISEQIDKVENLTTFVKNAENISEDDLDQIGANYSVPRSLGTISTGIITFQATVRPNQRIQIGNDDGSGGVSIKTLTTESGDSYEFVTTETVYMNPDATYNQEHNCYEVSAPIQAKSSGSIYNVGVGTITVLSQGIAGITGCYNYVSTTGGSDIQDQTSYAQSIQNAILGTSKNIEAGINSLLLDIDGVTEVKTLHPNSTEEPTDTGYALSYIRGDIESIEKFTFTYSGTNYSFAFPQKPVTRIVSVEATVNGQLKTLNPESDYSLIIDDQSVYAHTIYANDRIELLKTVNGTPDTGTEVVVNYAYNQLVADCQEELNNQLQNYLVLGELLVAQAIPDTIDIETTIKLKYGYNTEVIRNSIITGLSNYILSLPLGQDLTQEEVFTFLSTTYPDYISGITYPFIVFKKRNDLTNSTLLEFTYGEYASIDENSLSITFE